MKENLTEIPSYISLFQKAGFEEKEENLKKRLYQCDLCPNECGVNRQRGETGDCNAGSSLTISAASPHFGEEEPLVGTGGSGTIFFCHCPMHCVYCQNYEISQKALGYHVTEKELSQLMLKLQAKGCHNINLVTPTHYIPYIISSIKNAISSGLKIPIVYNTSGYESIKTLRELEGIIDIYMPDFKYWDEKLAYKYSKIHNYPEKTKDAIHEMYRQVGNLKCNTDGIAYRGLIVRHLILPNNIARSFEILKFIANEISKDTYINIMAQYHPAYHAYRYNEINRRISREEYNKVINFAWQLGLYRGFSEI